MDKYRSWVIFMVSSFMILLCGWQVILTPSPASLTNDSNSYQILALQLTEGRFENDFRTLGYPAFLLLTNGFPNSDLRILLITQLILAASTAVIVSLISWHLSQDSLASFLTGLAYSFCPVSYCIALQVMSETLHIFFVAAASFFAICRRSPMSLIAQLFFWGLAALTRPSGLLLPYIVAGSIIVACVLRKMDRCHWKNGIGVIVLYSLFLITWAGLNYQKTGYLMITSVPDVAIYMYELPAAQMVDQFSWVEYTRLWVFSPREAEAIRQVQEKRFIDQVYKSCPIKPSNLWETTTDLTTVKWLRSEAEQQLRGKILTIVGTHLIGALQVIRPIPPKVPGGMFSTILDSSRILLLSIAIISLIIRHKYGVLAVLIMLILFALLLPGVCGVWRFRSMAEPAISLLLGIGLATLLQRKQVEL